MSIIEKLGITAGPWGGVCLRENGCKCGYIFAGDDCACIARVYFNDQKYPEKHDPMGATITLKQAKANQSIIASAPEMLEALIKNSICIYNNDMDNPMYKGNPPIKHKDIIQKATGKTWEEIKELINE